MAGGVPQQLRGARSGATSQDLSFLLGTLPDHARARGGQVAALFLGRVKCFDRVARELAFELQRASGCPDFIARAREKLYAKLARRFRLGLCFGPPFLPSNSMVQGCVWPVDDIALLMATWVRHLAWRVPRVIAGVFVDDNSLVAEGDDGDEVLAEAAAVTEEFDHYTAQRVNAAKTVGTATSPELLGKVGRLFVHGDPVDTAPGAKLVGDYLRFHGAEDNAATDARIADTLPVLTKISRAPLGLDGRAELAASFGPARALHGTEHLAPSAAAARDYGRKAREAVLRSRFKHPWTCMPVV